MNLNQSKSNIASMKTECGKPVPEGHIGLRTNTSPIGKLTQNDRSPTRKSLNKIDSQNRISKQRSELKLNNVTT